MNVRHGDHTHEVYLCDDGTLDTVIEVDGTEVRYDDTREYRRRDGSMTLRGLRALTEDACDSGLAMDEKEG